MGEWLYNGIRCDDIPSSWSIEFWTKAIKNLFIPTYKLIPHKYYLWLNILVKSLSISAFNYWLVLSTAKYNVCFHLTIRILNVISWEQSQLLSFNQHIINNILLLKAIVEVMKIFCGFNNVIRDNNVLKVVLLIKFFWFEGQLTE